MPDWFNRLRQIVWSAVAAVVIGILSVATAFAGQTVQIVVSLTGLAVVFAVLAPKET